jgi:MoaA/NifB/PqqE/SkfB family radical SAM enzyme
MADAAATMKRPLHLDGIVQLEVTSRCNLSCPTCIHSVASRALLRRDMPREIFDRAVDATVREGQRYHLQGWGEPLLRRDLPELARSIVDRGGRPSVTTNGTRINPDLAAELVEAGLEIVTISIAGGDAEAQRSNRPGSDLERILDAFRTLEAAKKRQRSKRPLLAASYELTRSGVPSLPDLVGALKKAGVQRLIAINPILVLSAEQERNLLVDVTDPAEEESLLRALRRAAVATMWRSLSYHCEPVLEPALRRACPEDPPNSLFIGAGGDVSPCAFLGIPTEGTLSARFLGRDVPWKRVSMGNLNEAFRTAHLAQATETKTGSPPIGSEPAASLPEPCRGCLRALGY